MNDNGLASRWDAEDGRVLAQDVAVGRVSSENFYVLLKLGFTRDWVNAFVAELARLAGAPPDRATSV
jgi:hypothetical protein